MSRRYLAVLAVAAALVLSVGMFIRGRLGTAHEPAAAPPSEASALQQLSQEGQLRRMAGYLAERADALAASVVYVPAAGAAGVRWAADTVLTTSTTRAVTAGPPPASDSAVPPVALASDSARGDWVLAVGRRADGRVVSTAGLAGGRVAARCGDQDVERYVVSVPLAEDFAGAGLFDLDGRALGMVLRCDAGLAAVPARDVRRLLAAPRGPGGAVPGAFGVAVDSLGAAARTYFGADSGWLVTAVQRGGAADRAGLQPGDVLAPAFAPARLVSAQPGDTLTLARVRGRARSTVRLVAAADAAANAMEQAGRLGLRVAPPPAPGVPVAAVAPGSAAAAAGLRPGDRLLRVGTAPVATSDEAARALDALGTGAAFLVFERDAVARGVLVAAPGASPGLAPAAASPAPAGRP